MHVNDVFGLPSTVKRHSFLVNKARVSRHVVNLDLASDSLLVLQAEVRAT